MSLAHPRVPGPPIRPSLTFSIVLLGAWALLLAAWAGTDVETFWLGALLSGFVVFAAFRVRAGQLAADRAEDAAARIEAAVQRLVPGQAVERWRPGRPLSLAPGRPGAVEVGTEADDAWYVQCSMRHLDAPSAEEALADERMRTFLSDPAAKASLVAHVRAALPHRADARIDAVPGGATIRVVLASLGAVEAELPGVVRDAEVAAGRTPFAAR